MSETGTVAAWHVALNSGDVDGLLALSHPDVEVGGPRGSDHGAPVLRSWAEGADIRLEPLRTFHRAGTVVVEQEAEWRTAAPGEVQTVATVFLVEDGVVRSVMRYPDLASALRAADLDETDENPPGRSIDDAGEGGFRPLAENGGSYEAAGVSIERGERTVDLMRAAVEETHGPEVVGTPGGFAGLYALAGYRDPVLASTIDGVGTKVLVAREVGRYDSLGTDIVNHCANDVLATGAAPLFFLDYVGSGRLDPEAVSGIVRGAAEACGRLGVALIGGETAEMPGLYGRGDFEIVGVCVGACERGETVGGERVRPGDAVLGLASSGLHTNGYTLARGVLADAGVSFSDRPDGLNRPVGDVYLEPHRAYPREIGALRGAVDVRGMAHVTGGGLVGNLPRAFGGLGARLDADLWEEPAVFGLIRSLGNVSEEEMRRVFNLGVGFCAVVAPEDAEPGLQVLHRAGCEAWQIGKVVEGGGVTFA